MRARSPQLALGALHTWWQKQSVGCSLAPPWHPIDVVQWRRPTLVHRGRVPAEHAGYAGSSRLAKVRSRSVSETAQRRPVKACERLGAWRARVGAVRICAARGSGQALAPALSTRAIMYAQLQRRAAAASSYTRHGCAPTSGSKGRPAGQAASACKYMCCHCMQQGVPWRPRQEEGAGRGLGTP